MIVSILCTVALGLIALHQAIAARTWRRLAVETGAKSKMRDMLMAEALDQAIAAVETGTPADLTSVLRRMVVVVKVTR